MTSRALFDFNPRSVELLTKSEYSKACLLTKIYDNNKKHLSCYPYYYISQLTDNYKYDMSETINQKLINNSTVI